MRPCTCCWTPPGPPVVFCKLLRPDKKTQAEAPLSLPFEVKEVLDQGAEKRPETGAIMGLVRTSGRLLLRAWRADSAGTPESGLKPTTSGDASLSFKPMT